MPKHLKPPQEETYEESQARLLSTELVGAEKRQRRRRVRRWLSVVLPGLLFSVWVVWTVFSSLSDEDLPTWLMVGIAALFVLVILVGFILSRLPYLRANDTEAETSHGTKNSFRA